MTIYYVGHKNSLPCLACSSRSFTYMTESMGNNMNPCGTSHDTVLGIEFELPTLVHCFSHPVIRSEPAEYLMPLFFNLFITPSTS